MPGMLDRRTFILSGLGACALAAGSIPSYRLSTAIQVLANPVPAKPAPDADTLTDAEAWAAKLVASAEQQIGQTTIYDPAYVRLDYPGGDIAMERGVCTDVIVRAYREAFGADLQMLVHKDMRRNFALYPKIWRAPRPDRNIDHRRVPNLATFFRRMGSSRPISDDPADYLPGSIITQVLPGNRPHIAIVSNRPAADGNTPMIIHNIGAGTRLEDRLFEFEITGHFRYKPV